MIQVHDPELNVLKSVLDRQSFEGALFRNLKGEYFKDETYGQAWTYLREHYRDYGKVPGTDTFLKDFPSLKEYVLNARPSEPPEFYADKILEVYVRSGVAENLIQKIPSLETDVQTGIQEIKQTLSEYELVRNKVDIFTLGNTGRERWDEFQKEQVYGVPFGWETLDDATLGAHAGDLILTVARPGLGKTWLLLYNSHIAWEQEHTVLTLATEVPSLRMLQRLDTIHLSVDYDMFKKRILLDQMKEKYRSFLLDEDEEKERYKVVDSTGLTPTALGVLIEQTDPDILFIDSVHKLEPDRSYRDEWQKFRYLANELKDNVAQKYGIPVVCNTHFNRNVDNFRGKHSKGSLSDVAGGDEWGKVADLVMGLGRGEDNALKDMLELYVIKGREAEDGKRWHVNFDFTRMDFTETEPYYTTEDAEREENKKEMNW